MNAGGVPICWCCGAPPAGKNSGGMTKSAREKSCDATRKESTETMAIVRPMATEYGARAATASASIKTATTR